MSPDTENTAPESNEAAEAEAQAAEDAAADEAPTEGEEAAE